MREALPLMPASAGSHASGKTNVACLSSAGVENHKGLVAAINSGGGKLVEIPRMNG